MKAVNIMTHIHGCVVVEIRQTVQTLLTMGVVVTNWKIRNEAL